ncbi:thioredoxin domain-containing protein [Leptolyngbya sp. 15MV]|nr:thioredoxin domain-containing protein [Leptolyngbya sp. 15MV]
MSRSLFLTALVALVAGFGGAALWSLSGLGDAQVRRYLLAHPELLPEMAEAFQQQEVGARLAEMGDAVTMPFAGAVLGNPRGTVTLVEFTDYGCTYCRAAAPHVEQLIAANPELKVVIREWPIFEGSELAARMALAAARQDRFAAFHNAMFERGPPSAESVEAAARDAGLDLDAARAFAGSQEADMEIARNHGLARRLGFGGMFIRSGAEPVYSTPFSSSSWVSVVSLATGVVENASPLVSVPVMRSAEMVTSLTRPWSTCSRNAE